MARLFIAISLLLTYTIAFGAESIVFQAFPNQNNGKPISKKDAAQSGVLIKKVDGKYVWASREDKELLYSRSGIFHIFVAASGSGFISIMDSSTLPEGIRGNGPAIQYGEHIRNGIDVISYTGIGAFIKP